MLDDEQCFGNRKQWLTRVEDIVMKRWSKMRMVQEKGCASGKILGVAWENWFHGTLCEVRKVRFHSQSKKSKYNLQIRVFIMLKAV